jgi:hypothetical protein
MDPIEPTTEASGAGTRDWLQASQDVIISAYVNVAQVIVHDNPFLTMNDARNPLQETNRPMTDHAQRNRALHIPLDFETAVEGLLNVKPKKKRPKK